LLFKFRHFIINNLKTINVFMQVNVNSKALCWTLAPAPFQRAILPSHPPLPSSFLLPPLFSPIF
jgi:hypothetical protein